MLKEGKSNGEIIDGSSSPACAGCRRPKSEPALIRRVEMAADRRESLEDVLWGLLNSKEFLLRR